MARIGWVRADSEASHPTQSWAALRTGRTVQTKSVQNAGGFRTSQLTFAALSGRNQPFGTGSTPRIPARFKQYAATMTPQPKNYFEHCPTKRFGFPLSRCHTLVYSYRIKWQTRSRVLYQTWSQEFFFSACVSSQTALCDNFLRPFSFYCSLAQRKRFSWFQLQFGLKHTAKKRSWEKLF